MGSKNEAGIEDKLARLSKEAIKIEEKLDLFRSSLSSKYEKFNADLHSMNDALLEGNCEDSLPEELKIRLKSLLDSVKACTSDAIKKHREVHVNVSKFGVSITKTFVDELSNVTSYFTVGRSTGVRKPEDQEMDPPPQSQLYQTADDMTKDELFSTIIIEDLIRNGHGAVAIQLAKEVGLSEEDIGFKQFCEIGEMVSALKCGELRPAETWLQKHSESLGGKSRLLEYVLAKLDFLIRVQQCIGQPGAVLESMRSFKAYASDFPADFEHVMGSLVFLGQSLKGTPYADLTLEPMPSPQSAAFNGDLQDGTCQDENGPMSDPSAGGVALPLLPLIGLSSDVCMVRGSAQCDPTGPPNAFVRAAHLFGTVACSQLGLSSIDPLRIAFASGLRVLPKLHALQRAIAWLTKYGSSTDSSNTLPIPVELDVIAHRHNIFHCPVIKELTNMANTPVRLTCGHAISRDAFNSLASTDRRKVKCPYCPMDTHKNQVMDLIF